MALIELRQQCGRSDQIICGVVITALLALACVLSWSRLELPALALTLAFLGSLWLGGYLLARPLRVATVRAWYRLLHPLALLLTLGGLAAVYFLILTPLGLLLRLFGYDPLRRRGPRSSSSERGGAARSYWTPIEGVQPLQRYFSQH